LEVPGKITRLGQAGAKLKAQLSRDVSRSADVMEKEKQTKFVKTQLPSSNQNPLKKLESVSANQGWNFYFSTIGEIAYQAFKAFLWSFLNKLVFSF
jgi:hypothetical protein